MKENTRLENSSINLSSKAENYVLIGAICDSELFGRGQNDIFTVYIYLSIKDVGYLSISVLFWGGQKVCWPPFNTFFFGRGDHGQIGPPVSATGLTADTGETGDQSAIFCIIRNCLKTEMV